MLDPKLLRSDLDGVAARLARRGLVFDRDRFTALECERKRLQGEVETLRSRRNERSKEIGRVKAQGGDVDALKAEVGQLGGALEQAEKGLAGVADELDALLASLPNMPHESVPEGADEAANVEVRRHGEPPTFDFAPKDHIDLGQGLGLIDFEAAAKL